MTVYKPIEQQAKEWQQALRLMDWDITVEVISRAEFDYKYPKYAGQECTGMNSRDWHHHGSVISLVDTIYLEEDLVHELSHMLLDPFQLLVEEVIEYLPAELKDFSTTALKHRLEESVNMVATALINARKVDKSCND